MDAPNLSGDSGVSIPDEELAARARKGDSEAFGVLVERHHAAVFGFLLGTLRDLELAEEAAQDAFMKAYEHIGTFSGRSSFQTWVTQIALNTARSRLRWRKVRGWLSLSGSPDDPGWEERLRPPGASADELRAVDKRIDLERSMRSLSPREREVVSLRLEGYALSEIAQTLEISEGTVKSTLFAATQKMRAGTS